MNFFKIFILIVFISLNLSKVYAVEFSHLYGSLGIYQHTAKDAHDSLGSTYHKDPDDKNISTSLGYVYKNGNLLWDTELSYYNDISHTLTTGVNVDIRTLSLMENLIFVSEKNSGGYLMAGAGLGFASIGIDLDYSSGGDTFSKDKTITNLGHQFLLGYGINNIEIVYKYIDFGEVSGPSGTTKDGNAYVSDEFDNILNSISLRYKF